MSDDEDLGEVDVHPTWTIRIRPPWWRRLLGECDTVLTINPHD